MWTATPEPILRVRESIHPWDSSPLWITDVIGVRWRVLMITSAGMILKPSSAAADGVLPRVHLCHVQIGTRTYVVAKIKALNPTTYSCRFREREF